MYAKKILDCYFRLIIIIFIFNLDFNVSMHTQIVYLYNFV